MGPQGPQGDLGLPGATADLHVYSAELPFDGDIQLGLFANNILSVQLPAGAYQASANVAIVNRGDPVAGSAYRVDVWFTVLGTGGASRIAGPRAVQARVLPGMATSVSLGPVFAQVDSDTTLQLVAQRDSLPPGAQIWVTEGTDLMNRAGSTGLLVWGGTAAFPAPPI